MGAPKAKDDPNEQLVLNVLDSDEFDPAAATEGSPELVGELVRVRAIMQAFDSLGTTPPAAAPPIPHWGPFVLREQVGRGRFGTVCRAFDPAVQRDVAVKLYAGADLPAEPRLMARVRHPNVVTVFGAAVHEGRPGIWMELVHGHSLGHRVQADGPLAPGEVLRIGIALCDALDAVHGAQLVHQDVKARNVMQEDNGRVVLMDFGAGLSSDDGDMPERFSGTPVYMAPEVMLGQRPSVASDVYSLGVLLYYLLTGTYPVYAPDVEELRRLHERHHRAGTRRFVATLRELRPEVSPALARCLARALAPTDHRYKTAAEFETALETVRLGVSERPRRRARFWAAVLMAMTFGGAVVKWIDRPRPAPPMVLTRVTSDEGLTTDPALSADGKLLAYASDRSGNGSLDLWMQQTAGGEPLRLTTDVADDAQPTFSPDGSRLVFRSERDGGGLYVMSALGGDARRIAANGHWPRFSPDGRYLAYMLPRGVVIANPEGRVIRELHVLSPPEVVPVWSPDSRRVLVVAEGLRGRVNDADRDWDWVVLSVDESAADGALLETGVTDVLGRRRRSQIERRPAPSQWIGDRILFDATVGDATHLWEIDIDPRTFRIRGEARRLTLSSESQRQPQAGPDGRMFFATVSASVALWEASLNAEGLPHAEARKLGLAPTRHVLEGISDNGRRLTLATHRFGSSRIWIKDFENGTDRALTDTPLLESFPVIARDGSSVFYRVSEGDRTAVYSVAYPDGVPERVCDDCGFPTDISPDKRSLILQQAFTTSAGLDLFDVVSGRQSPLLTHSDYTIFRGRFSPDGKWLAFHASHKGGGTREFVARLEGSHPIPDSQWIPVTDSTSASDSPRWSVDGTRIYYLSTRDGHLCVWAQRLDAETRRPVGGPFPVYHAHNRARSFSNIDSGGADIAVARDKIVFGMAEVRGNIWSASVHQQAE